MRHEMTGFEVCSLLNSGHAYSHGYDRAVCTCGWKSAASNDKQALISLWKIHKDDAKAEGK